MKSSITLGRHSALLAIAALALACSSSTSGTTSSGTGGVGTGGTNGGASSTGGTVCGHAGDSCALTACCTGLGLTCNSSQFCIATQSSGTGTTTGGPTVDPCPVGGEDAGCATSVECEAGLLCVSGVCSVPANFTPQCSPSGQAPSDGVPCCESTQDAGAEGLTCVGWIPCSTTGQGCSESDDCCNGLSCTGDGGTCAPVCNAVLTSCTTDSDCCADEGLRCVKGSMFSNTPPIPGSICYPLGLPIQQAPGGGSYYCDSEPQCKGFTMGNKGIVDCQLGATCNSGIPLDGGADPCAVDGLVCDLNFHVCRNPDLFDPCVPGGPACNPVANTNSPVICSQPIFVTQTGESQCTYECQTSEDCVLPWQSCVYEVNPTYQDCQYAVQSTGCAQNTPSDLLQTCNAASVNDGICLAIGGLPTPDSLGLCTQAFTDGDGGAGQACNINGNRQLGGLCDTKDICLGNICSPLCNAGTSKNPGCGEGLDCVPVMDLDGINLGPDPTVDAITTGACVTPCDVTVQDAGQCEAVADEPAKCLPAELFGYAAGEVTDFCGAAASGAQAIPIGGACANAIFGNALDPCVAGAVCYGTVGTTSTCLELCEGSNHIGQKGAAGGCPTGYTCAAANYANTPSTHIGLCTPTADGG